MKNRNSQRSKMYAESIPKEDLYAALKIIQKPAVYSASATNLQRVRVELIENWWRIYAWWIAYEQMLVDSIRKKPYNTPAYQRARSAARLLSAKLKLCEQLCIAGQQLKLYGFSPNQQPHQYALELWVSCMIESKQKEVNNLFEETENPETSQGISKDSVLRGYRSVLQSLRDDHSIPSSWIVKYPLNSAVLKECLILAWGRLGGVDYRAANPNRQEFRDNCWNIYLEIYNDYIKDVKAQAQWKGFFEKDGRLFYYEKGKPRVLGFNAWHPTVQNWWNENIQT